MSKLSSFFDRHLGYFMVIPAILCIVIFSILPILASTQYAFFDFQLNDQQKSGMYFNTHYNADVVEESLEYLVYYGEMELDGVLTPSSVVATKQYIEQIKTHQNELHKMLPTEGITEISDQAQKEYETIRDQLRAEVDTLYASHSDLLYKEDVLAVYSGMDEALVKKNFVGVKQFATVLKDPRVHKTLGITLIFTLSSVFFELILGLVLALIMNKAMRGKGFIRTISLIPWAIPTSVAALIWAYLYDGSSGIVAVLLEKLHIIGSSTDLLMSSTAALGAVIMADVWKTTPYMALLLLAGLQTISDSLYEAAAVDGANKLKQFWSITLPLLKPSIFVALLFRTLDAFRVFDLIFVLTGGGPGGSTESISIYAYKTMFAQTQFGYGAAIVIIMALTVGVISYAYMKLLDIKLVQD